MTAHKPLVLSIAVVALALSGCGGGGGGSAAGTPAPTPSAEGAYFGTVSDGRQHYTLVLENGQLYALYGSTSAGVFDVSGVLQGNGTSSNGSYASSDVKDASAAGTLVAATLSASYTAGSSFNGTVTEAGGSVSFTGSALSTAVYNYNVAASLATVAGTWNMTSLRGFPTTLTVAADGSFNATSSGCAFSGTFKPRSSGKNVLDVALTYGPSPCILAGKSLSGIAISYALSGGGQQLAIVALDAARTSSSAFFGVR